jgi:hypothetical protein
MRAICLPSNQTEKNILIVGLVSRNEASKHVSREQIVVLHEDISLCRLMSYNRAYMVLRE